MIPFDTTQVTSAGNYSSPQNGDTCHPISATAHPPAIAHTLRAEGHDASEDGTGRGVPLVAGAVSSKWAKGTGGPSGDEAQNLTHTALPAWQPCPCCDDFWCNIHQLHTHECPCPEIDEWTTDPYSPTSSAAMAVRRLTAKEVERLMGFPDDFTLIPYRGKPACDGPRYRALGNSMAVPLVRWLGQRIELVEEVERTRNALSRRAP